jgi:hypothetical protein
VTTDIPHGTVTGRKYHRCGCLPCRVAISEYNRDAHRQKAYGTWQPFVDAEPVRLHVEKLRQAGLGRVQIAAAAGVDPTVVSRLLYSMSGRPRTTKMRPEMAAKFLAVTPAQRLDTAMVDATGTRRRLQALQVVGWPQKVIAVHAGMNQRQISALIRAEKVFVRTARTITGCYDQLWDQVPEEHAVAPAAADRARNAARRHGWFPPAAWDDIDDPQAVPDVGDRSKRTVAIAEDVEFMLRHGVDRDEIARRVGLGSWNSVEQALLRAKQAA